MKRTWVARPNGVSLAYVETLSAPLGMDRRCRGLTRRRDYTQHRIAVLRARATYLHNHGGVPHWIPGPGLRTVTPYAGSGTLAVTPAERTDR